MCEAVRRLVFLFGPTAVGKTDLLLKLFACGRLPGAEIISADSMQVYRYMDIGSAKPSVGLRARLPHHLIDIRNPNEQFHAGDFVTLAEALAEDVASTGRIPVVAGGTAFYFRNLLYGLPGTPAGNVEARMRIREREVVVGIAGLHNDLAIIDPRSAARIERNDRYRIIRALEVFYSSGIPLSDYPVPQTPRRDLDVLIIGLNRPRDQLYGRIETRVEMMFEQGLCSEVARLLQMGYLPADPGFRGIGYREFWEQFQGESHSSADQFGRWIGSLDEEAIVRLKSLIKLDSRRYAKRQITFFRQLPEVQWYDPEDDEAVAEAVARFWERGG